MNRQRPPNPMSNQHNTTVNQGKFLSKINQIQTQTKLKSITERAEQK